jgi:hypothetical protein
MTKYKGWRIPPRRTAGVPLARLIFAVTFYAAFGTYGAMMLRTNK